MNINYKSDFSFALHFAAGFPSNNFRGFIYSLVNPAKTYVFSFIDGVYTNCANNNGNIQVSCDNHGLRTGKLVMLFVEDIPNEAYPDGYYNKTTYIDLGITLTNGISDTGDIVVDADGGNDDGGGGGSVTPPSKIGVFIELVGGELVKADDFDASTQANSIFVSDGEHSVKLALKDIYVKTGEVDDFDNDIYAKKAKWYSGSSLINGCTLCATAEEAHADFAGRANTDAILLDRRGGTIGTPYGYAAIAVDRVIFADTTKGYLGGAGEWKLVTDNLDAVNACLTACGGDNLDTSEYWTSTQVSASHAFTSKDTTMQKTKPLFVRAFADVTGNEFIKGASTGTGSTGNTGGSATDVGSYSLDYNRLINRPTNLSDFTNDCGYNKTEVTSDGKMRVNDADVALSYEHLSDKPTIPAVTKGAIEALGINVPFAQVTNAPNFATQNWVEGKGYLTEHQSLAAYVTQAWINAQNFLKEHQSLAAYVTKAALEAKGYLTEHQSLTEYATQAWVQALGYITMADLAGFASETYVQNAKPKKLSEMTNDIATVSMAVTYTNGRTETFNIMKK